MLKGKTPKVSQIPTVIAPAVSWGAAAVATVGRVTVEVEESLNTPEWQLSLDTPAFYVRVGIEGPEFITRLHDFLTAQRRGAAKDEFLFGRHGSQNVNILRDNEPGVRYFIVIGSDEKSSVRLTFADVETRDWVDALADIRDQLRG